MVIHNYRQGISVNSQIYSGPPVNIWERDTDQIGKMELIGMDPTITIEFTSGIVI
jgi:hypothetical protein